MPSLLTSQAVRKWLTRFPKSTTATKNTQFHNQWTCIACKTASTMIELKNKFHNWILRMLTSTIKSRNSTSSNKRWIMFSRITLILEFPERRVSTGMKIERIINFSTGLTPKYKTELMPLNSTTANLWEKVIKTRSNKSFSNFAPNYRRKKSIKLDNLQNPKMGETIRLSIVMRNLNGRLALISMEMAKVLPNRLVKFHWGNLLS